MPLVSGRPPRSRWSGPPLCPPSLTLLVHLRDHAVQDDTGDLFFGSPGDESFLLAADDVDLVLGGVGHGVPVSRRESYHKEVGIPFPDSLEYVGRGCKLQARRPRAAPDLL